MASNSEEDERVSPPDDGKPEPPPTRRAFWHWIAHVVPPIVALSTTLGSATALIGISGSKGDFSTVIRSEETTFIVASSVFLLFGTLASFKSAQRGIESAVTGMVSVCPVPALVLILVLLATVAVTVVIATTNRLLAGGVIMSFAMLRLSFRLANRSPQTWTSMKFHIKAEMFFQSVAMVSLGVAAALMISGIPNKGYELAPRVALSATLVLASVIAANRTASRGRKVCTRIWSDVKDVVRAQEVLRLAAGDGGERLKKIQEFKECVDSLEAALRTCFDTGYRMLGTTVLPEKEIEALIERLGRLPDVYDAGSLEWMDAKEDLTRVSAACHPWIDVAA